MADILNKGQAAIGELLELWKVISNYKKWYQVFRRKGLGHPKITTERTNRRILGIFNTDPLKSVPKIKTQYESDCVKSRS